MSWIFEGPWPILLTGVIFEAILVIALVRTGRGALLWGVVGVGVLTGGLLVLERAIVTDNELIRETLDGICSAAETNDAAAVLVYVAPDAESVRRLVNDGLRQVTIKEASIGGDLAIQITRQGEQPMALAKFTGHIRAVARREALGRDMFVARFSVGLVKQQGKWLVTSVDQRDFSHP
jgi:hypothetical protein